jgi:ABC-type amino acid transport system permease subunit
MQALFSQPAGSFHPAQLQALVEGLCLVYVSLLRNISPVAWMYVLYYVQYSTEPLRSTVCPFSLPVLVLCWLT